MILGARLIASATPSEQEEFLRNLSSEEIRGLKYLFEFWAMPHQLPPDGAWKTWVILGGRGAGKTRAGSEWVRSQVEGSGPEDTGVAKRVALVGETYDQARDVMVHGESGILACTPEDRRPKWIADRRKLIWPNGAEAKVFSANDYEALRGPQFDAAWVDELAKWPRAEEAWDMLQFALRLGENPQQVITTTPRDIPILKRVLASETTVVTQAATRENEANLAASFLEEVEGQFGGTQLGRQELEGVVVEELEGALWTRAMLMAAGDAKAIEPDRIVVAVDPPVSSKVSSDACGIVVAGVKMDETKGDWRGVVLEDASLDRATPLEWATRAVEMYQKYDADRIVAEVNQGGDLVEEMVRQVERTVSYRAVHARRGKVIRAEPVAALYEQQRVAHRRGLGELEAQMLLMQRSGFAGRGSPDRVDALVWALTDLMIKPAPEGRPQIRGLG
ncbi:MAG: terminase family protein [Pseudomonadota bacterium]